MSRHDRHDGVSCDVCSRSNFRGKRYKCLMCNDYDLCANCYENGAVSLAHLATHPMQVILTKTDFDLYFRGESVSQERSQSFTCGTCGRAGLTEATLYEHVRSAHGDAPIEGSSCPLCVASWRGDPNRKLDDLLVHLAVEHRLGSAADVDRHHAAFASFLGRNTAGRGGHESAGLTRSGAFRVLPSTSVPHELRGGSLRAPGSVYAPPATGPGATAVLRRRLGPGPGPAASESATVPAAGREPEATSAFAEALFGVSGGVLFGRTGQQSQPNPPSGQQSQSQLNASDREREVQAEHDALAELLAQLEGRLGGGRPDLASLTQRMEQSILNQLERQYDSARSSGLSSRSSQPASVVPVSLSLAASATAGGRQATSQQQAAAATSLMHALLGSAVEQPTLVAGAATHSAPVPRASAPAESPFLLVHNLAERPKPSDAVHEPLTSQLVLSALYDSLIHLPDTQQLVNVTDAFEHDRLRDTFANGDSRGQPIASDPSDSNAISVGCTVSRALHNFDAASIAASPNSLCGATQPAQTAVQRALQPELSQTTAARNEAAAVVAAAAAAAASQRDSVNNNNDVASKPRFVADSIRVATQKMRDRELEEDTFADPEWQGDLQNADRNADGVMSGAQQADLVSAASVQ